MCMLRVEDGYQLRYCKNCAAVRRNMTVTDIMKREDQQDATIRCLLLTSVSTCFGHHYAHLQENKGPVTAYGVLRWFCWVWLVAVVGRCVVGCEKLQNKLLILN